MTITTCIIVALIWGSTNNLIKFYTPKEKLEDSDSDSKSNQTTKNSTNNFFYYLLNYKFTLSLLINQLGSVYFNYSLGSVEITKFIPIVNALREVAG